MLSRVADSLYWMSRYMERTDGILRMLKINYASSQDDTQEFSWKPVLRIFSYLEEEEATVIATRTRAVLQYMIADKENDYQLAPGDIVRVETGGGGGYGSPRERAIELIQRDLDAGYVSREAAERDYGVAVGPDATARR